MQAVATAAGFKPVKRSNLTSQVAETVRSYITENNLQPGDRLPTEKELTRMLMVSRNVLREALKGLELIGMIDIRVGDGTYVSQPDYASLVNRMTADLARNDKDRRCIAQAFSFLESHQEVQENPVLYEFRSLLSQLLR